MFTREGVHSGSRKANILQTSTKLSTGRLTHARSPSTDWKHRIPHDYAGNVHRSRPDPERPSPEARGTAVGLSAAWDRASQERSMVRPMATCNVRGAGSEGVRGEWGGARAPCMALPFQAPNPRTRVAPDNASCVGQAPACRTRLLSWSPNDQARSSVVLSNGSCCSYTQLPGSFRAAGGEGRTRGLWERVRKGPFCKEPWNQGRNACKAQADFTIPPRRRLPLLTTCASLPSSPTSRGNINAG